MPKLQGQQIPDPAFVSRASLPMLAQHLGNSRVIEGANALIAKENLLTQRPQFTSEPLRKRRREPHLWPVDHLARNVALCQPLQEILTRAIVDLQVLRHSQDGFHQL